jgi:hypothetical protein
VSSEYRLSERQRVGAEEAPLHIEAVLREHRFDETVGESRLAVVASPSSCVTAATAVDADPPWADQQAHDDEQETEKDVAGDERDDAEDDQDDRSEP